MSGSTWSIWDFHLHSPYSILNNEFGDPENEKTWEKYVTAIEKASKRYNVEAIGITDYFTIDGYKKLKQFQKNGDLQGIFLFPNIEFRADYIIYRDNKTDKNPQPSEGKRLNFHVLFSPDVTIENIEENFLHDLDFVYEADPFEKGKTKKLKNRNLVEFGQRLKREHPNFEKYSDFYTGCMNAVVSIRQADELLRNQFKGQYLLVLADEDLSLLSWDGQHHGTRKQLVQMSHAVLSSNSGTKDFLLGKTHSRVQDYLGEFKHLKPCIWGCDSHGYENRFLKPDKDRFCWIKGDVSWEGLKQILFEPEDRVSIQPTNPEFDKSIYTINSLQVEGTKIRTDLEIKPFSLNLNSNLVAIIGGRGSGKTALLDLIASCFREGRKLEKIEPSFFYRLYENKELKQMETSAPINLALTFQSGEQFETSVGDKNHKIFESSDILYLTQNHFDELAANPDIINKHITDLIFEQNGEEKREYRILEDEINNIFNTIQQHNLDVQQIRNEVEDKEASASNSLKELKGDELDYTERIKRIEEKQNDSSDVTKELTERVSFLAKQKEKIDEVLSAIESFANQLKSIDILYSSRVPSINQSLKQILGDSTLYQLSNSLDGLSKHSGEFDKTTNALSSLKAQNIGETVEKEKSLGEFQGIDREIAEIRQKRDSIVLDIEKTNKVLQEIAVKKTKIAELENDRYIQYIDVLYKVRELKSFLTKTIQKFELGKNTLLENIRFEAQVKINSSMFIRTLSDKMHGRKITSETLESEYLPLFELLDKQMNSTESNDNIATFFTEFDASFREISFKSCGLRKDSTSLSDYYNAVFKNIYQIGMKVCFNSFGKEKELSALSMGERAVILLKILLALDDKPLLIDQPEEHLDNRYIYEELKPAFRKAKQSRQIIIATHNANLVVNTDAEQIIVANSEDGVLSYLSGTLENFEVRESIKQILEGGDEAFKKREEKYGYIF